MTECGLEDLSAWSEATGARARSRVTAIVVAVLSAVTLCGATAADAQNLTTRMDRLLDAPPFDRTLWGVAVLDRSGRLLYGRNERRLFVPASNTKLVVTVVAAALLPPNWTVRTSVYGTGPVAAGVLQGNLVLYGRGDPTMSGRCYSTDTMSVTGCERDAFTRLRVLADTLKARGIRTVAGDLIGDGSYFEPLTVHPAWNGFDLNWWYAAPVSGLGFHDNSVDFAWAPGLTLGAPATITMTPDLGDVGFENRTVTVPAGDTTDLPDRFYRVPGTLDVWADGRVALDHSPGTESFALPDPNLYAARALRQTLADAGIAVLGTTRSTTDSTLYAAARRTRPLAEVASRPLRDWIFPILNTSQNWFAEMLVKLLGRRFGRAGSWEEGIRVEKRFLIDSVKADSTEFSLEDGSGLVASNFISPLTFAKLLRFIRGHPRFTAFAAGLPQAGHTGSLRTRFVTTPLAGRVRAKTGSISGVNTLSGYVDLPSGEILTFSVEANHHAQQTKVILARIDSLVVEMARKR